MAIKSPRPAANWAEGELGISGSDIHKNSPAPTPCQLLIFSDLFAQAHWRAELDTDPARRLKHRRIACAIVEAQLRRVQEGRP